MKNALCYVLCVTSLVLAVVPATAATKVFLLAGQSNMGGCGVSAELVGPLAKYSGSQPAVNFWDSGGNQWDPLSSGSGDFGPELSFGYQMHTAFPNDNVYLVKYSWGGTSLFSDWNPNGNGACYNTFKSTALAAIETLNDAHLAPTVAGMLWMQGESDANDSTMAATYGANLTNFIATVRSDFNTANMPFVLGRITTAWGDPVDNAIVRATQVTVPTLVNNVSWVNTDDLEISTLIPPHYGTQGQIDLGIRFANQFIQTPEPSTLVLVLAGAIALFVYAWRRQR